MDYIVISLSDIQKSKEELKILNERYLKLYEKMEDLKKEKEYFDSLYMSKFGALIFLRFENEIKYRRLKKKLILIIKSKNKGEKINIEDIENVLEKELTDFYKNLNTMYNNLKKSQEFFQLPELSKEEFKKVKEIFRRLAKILHPDVNKNLNEDKIELWLKVKEAYENNDLVNLIILEGIVKSNELKGEIRIANIDENIDKIKKKISELQNFIDKEENSFPLNIKELIDDNEYIKNKKEKLTNEINEYKKMIEELENKIREVLKYSDYE